MHYCLDKLELSNFISYNFNNEVLDKNLELIVNNSKFWEDEISIINYLFTLFLESISFDENEKYCFIQELYKLQDVMFISIQEFDFDFIKSILLYEVKNELNFEEKLIEFQNRLRNYDFKSRQ